MKKLLKPAALLFYLLSILVFFLLGMSLAGITSAVAGQGLAGGAILFFYGIVTAFLAFIVSIVIAYRVKLKTITLLNKMIAVIFFALVMFFSIKFFTREKEEVPTHQEPTKTTIPVD